MDRKKELKEQYKQMKIPMGVILVECRTTGRFHVVTSPNLKASLTTLPMKLESGFFPDKELVKAWKQYGADDFTIRVLDELEQDPDPAKTNYSDELNLLKAMWDDKLKKQSE